MPPPPGPSLHDCELSITLNSHKHRSTPLYFYCPFSTLASQWFDTHIKRVLKLLTNYPSQWNHKPIVKYVYFESTRVFLALFTLWQLNSCEYQWKKMGCSVVTEDTTAWMRDKKKVSDIEIHNAIHFNSYLDRNSKWSLLWVFTDIHLVHSGHSLDTHYAKRM